VALESIVDRGWSVEELRESGLDADVLAASGYSAKQARPRHPNTRTRGHGQHQSAAIANICNDIAVARALMAARCVAARHAAVDLT
jgi:hypothetical protein